MRAHKVGRAVAGLVCAVAVSAVLTGCVIIPPPLTPIAPGDPVAPADPGAAPPSISLAPNPVSLTMRDGVPVVHLCEAMTVDWVVLSESLLTDDPSKGYVDVWQAVGNAHLAKGAEFAVGAAPLGLKQTASGKQTFDFTHDYWKVSLANLEGKPTTITQKFRAQDLIEGVWLDYKGRAASGPCESGA